MAKEKRLKRRGPAEQGPSEGAAGSVAQEIQDVRELPEWQDDPTVDKIVIGFLVAFFLFVLFTPAEWLLRASMWWNGIK